MIFNNIIFR